MAASEGAASGRDVGRQIQTIIGEYRVVLTALAVLFGFQLTISFAPPYADVAPWVRAANFAALLSSAAAIVFFLAPSSYHRLTQGVEESHGYLHLAQRNADAGFLFMLISIALSVGIQAERSFGDARVTLAAGVGMALVMVLAWWIMPTWRAVRRGTFGRRWLPHEEPDDAAARGSDASGRARRGERS